MGDIDMHRAHPPTRSTAGRFTDRLVVGAVAVLVVAGTATAFVQSYEGLYSWANRYLSDGWARTWPLQVDAWIAVGELALFIGYRDRWRARHKIWPWVAAASGLAVSTGFNVGHLADADLPGRFTAAVPPVAAFGGLYLGLQVLRRLDEAHQAATDRQTLAALQLATSVVAADRAHGRQIAAAELSVNESAPARRQIDLALETEAQRILTSQPTITGAELSRRLGLPERTGQRLLRRITTACRQ